MNISTSKEIKEIKIRIVERIVDKSRLFLVLKSDLIEVAEIFGIENAEKMKKVELINTIKLLLDAENIMDFSGIKRFGICKGDIPYVLNLSKGKCEKLLFEKGVRPKEIVHDHANGYDQIYYIFDIEKIIQLLAD